MPRYLFVTGRLAAPFLHECLRSVPGLEYEIAILPISVAALMNTGFIAKHLGGNLPFDKLMIPGSCEGDLDIVSGKTGAEVIRGPKNLKDLPGYFGISGKLSGYGEHSARILAEIVDAHRMTLEEILSRASYFRSSGADIIDLGCPADGCFDGVETVIAALKKAGHLVSIDTFDRGDILKAGRAGVDFVLSVNSRNMEAARSLQCKVVVIPDDDQGLESLERNIRQLEAWRVPYIIDPVLKPIGFGFSDSIEAFIAVRKKYPDSEMLIGAGNLTELTDADSTGINALIAGIVAELNINYVLTTEVVSWARGAVSELDHARRLMHFANKNKMLPKHLDDALLTIKDPPFEPYREDELREMQRGVRDHHFRIFADRDFIYVFNKTLFLKEKDISEIFKKLDVESAAHAFYLGRELQKAQLALKLGKRYIQDEDLRWGYLSGRGNLFDTESSTSRYK